MKSAAKLANSKLPNLNDATTATINRVADGNSNRRTNVEMAVDDRSRIPLTNLDYSKLEPRRVLTVVGAFNAGTGVLDITLDADFDTVTISHDGTNLLLNGSKDIDPLMGGSQEVLLANLSEIHIAGNNTLTGTSVDLQSAFDLANGVSLTDMSLLDVNDVFVSGNYQLAGKLDVRLHGIGGIDDGGAGKLTVAGDVDISANDGDIRLDNAGHDFQSLVRLRANGGLANDISIADIDGLTIWETIASGDLTINAGGDVSTSGGRSAKIDVGGTVSITADDGNALNTNNDISLGANPGDIIIGKQWTISTVDSVTIDSDSAVILSDVAAGSFTLQANGSISNLAGADVDVQGHLDVDGTSIHLGNKIGDNVAFNTLSFNSGGIVHVESDQAVTISGINSAQSLHLSADGAISDLNNTSISITKNAFFDADSGLSDVTLGDDALDTIDFGSVGVLGWDVSITEDSNTHLDGVSAENFVLATDSVVTQSGIDTGAGTNALSVNGNLSLTANGLGGSAYLARASTAPPAGVNDGVSLNNSIDGLTTLINFDTDIHLRNVSASATLPVGVPMTLENYEIDLTQVSVQLDSMTINQNLVVSSGVNVSDAPGAVINVGGNATFSAAGSIQLADFGTDILSVTGDARFSAGTTNDLGSLGDLSAGGFEFNSIGATTLSTSGNVQFVGNSSTGSLLIQTPGAITDQASTTMTVAGLADFSASSITLGDQVGDHYAIDSLTFVTTGDTDISVNADLVITGTSSANNLFVRSGFDVSTDAFADVVIAGIVDLDVGTASLGDAAFDSFDASGYRVTSTGLVEIVQLNDVIFVGDSVIESLYVDAWFGNIYGSAGGSLVVDNDATFLADFGNGDVDLASMGFTTRFDHHASDLSSGVSIWAWDAYLSTSGNITLSDIYVTNTFYLETAGYAGGMGGPKAQGDVYQELNSYVYTYELGIDAAGSVQLSGVSTWIIAVNSQLSANLTPGMTLNSVTDHSILGDAFGVVVRNDGYMDVFDVSNPFGAGTVTGVTAASGHIYLETMYWGDLYISENVTLLDPTQTITAIAAYNLYLFSGAQVERGTEGLVTFEWIPLQLTGTLGGTQFVHVDVLTGLQEIAFNYGISGDGNYSARVTWADGSVDAFDAAALTAINPNSNTIGEPNPFGDPTIIQKSTPYTAGSLLANGSLSSTLTVFSDLGIRLFENGGATNLSQVTYEFIALVGREHLSIPIEDEDEGVGISVDHQPHLTSVDVETSNVFETSQFSGDSNYVSSNVTKTYSVRLVEGQEVDRVSWQGGIDVGNLSEIEHAIIARSDSLPGIYSVRQVTSEGSTIELARFEKPDGRQELDGDIDLTDSTIYVNWYDQLATNRSPNALQVDSDLNRESVAVEQGSDSTGGVIETTIDYQNDRSTTPNGDSVPSETPEFETQQQAAPVAPDDGGEPLSDARGVDRIQKTATPTAGAAILVPLALSLGRRSRRSKPSRRRIDSEMIDRGNDESTVRFLKRDRRSRQN